MWENGVTYHPLLIASQRKTMAMTTGKGSVQNTNRNIIKNNGSKKACKMKKEDVLHL